MRKRITHYLVILIIIIISNFFIPRMLPGSPVGTLMGESAGDITAAEKMGILDAYHLNDPLHIQFAYYIRDFFTLNWGVSFSKRLPIIDLLKPAAGWTLLLSLVSLFFSVLIGTFLGAVSALRKNKKRDLPIVMGTTLMSSIPPFWIALLLLAVFGANLGWFPTYGAYSMWKDLHGMERILDIARHMFLPSLAIIITSLMPYFTTARYSVLKTIGEDYVHMAKIRGIPRKRITVFYIMRNAVVPVFTVVMLDIGYLLSGSVLIEKVFSYPGLGSLMSSAISARDYPLIQYTFLLTSIVTVAVLFITDICYKKIDPRMEAGDA